MTAVEDRLVEIEARAAAATDALPDGAGPALYALDQVVIHDTPVLVAALRAVMREADPGDLVIGAAAWVAGYQDAMSDVRAIVAAALDVTP